MPYLLADDIQIHYVVRGAGRPLVLLHGGLVDKQLWLPQIAAFAPRFQVLAYDLRGHGETAGLPRPSYSLDLFVADLRALLRTLAVRCPILCGLSLGGAVALAYAAAFPEDVTALILCGTAVSTAPQFAGSVLTATAGATLPLSVRLLGGPLFTSYALWMARLLHGERWLGRTHAVRTYLRSTMLAMDAAELARVYGLILALRPPELDVVRAPILLLNGEHETTSVRHQTAMLQQRLARATSLTVPDAGHVSNLDQPERFNLEVLAFLEASLERSH